MTRVDKAALISTSVLVPIVVTLTLIPTGDFPVSPPGNDKMSHVLAWAAICFPAAAARPKLVWGIFPAAIALGGCIEVIQPWVGRASEAADLVADSVGAIAGCALGCAVHRLVRKLSAMRPPFSHNRYW